MTHAGWKCPETGINLEKYQRIVVIGAGPTGLGAAHRLAKLGVLRSNTQVIVLDQQGIPGGLAASYRDPNGFLWDNGGHVVFSHYPYFTQTLTEAVSEWNKRTRAAYAFMKGSDGIRRFIQYPVQENIHAMDKVDQEKSLKGLEEITYNPSQHKPNNFDEWLLKNFGTGLCNIFMRKYNRKIWTVKTTEMNTDWVSERVAVPDINKIKAKITAFEAGKSANDSSWGPNRFFRFPRYGGTGGIWKAVAHQIPQGWFHFHHKVTGINVKEKELKVEVQGNAQQQYPLKYDYLISTVPLHSLLKMVNDTDETSVRMKKLAEELVYTHTHIVGIGLKGHASDLLRNKHWMYFPDSDTPFYRVTVFSGYSNDHVPPSGSYWSLMCEAAEPMKSYHPNYWTEENLVSETVKALVNYGFIRRDQIVSRYHRRLEYGYPVPFLKREELLTTVQPWLESKQIYSRGRFGGWRYEVGNQDHSFMQGVEVANFIMKEIPEETYPDPNRVNSMKVSNRNLSCSTLPMLVPEYEFVVSHFKENLDWLAPVANHCHIYHKGGQVIPRFEFHQWETLPNVGREGHTYVHHIINNYDYLANVTVFLQGSIEDEAEVGRAFLNISDYIFLARKYQYSAGSDRNRNFSKWEPTNKMNKASMTFAEFWRNIFGYPHPQIIEMSSGGCFAVTRKCIHQHTIAFYKNLISYLDYTRSPPEGYYLERLWKSIFTMKLPSI